MMINVLRTRSRTPYQTMLQLVPPLPTAGKKSLILLLEWKNGHLRTKNVINHMNLVLLSDQKVETQITLPASQLDTAAQAIQSWHGMVKSLLMVSNVKMAQNQMLKKNKKRKMLPREMNRKRRTLLIMEWKSSEPAWSARPQEKT